ncbi:MAG: signal peptide peptidase SppA [Nocardioidaceae bacterium]
MKPADLVSTRRIRPQLLLELDLTRGLLEAPPTTRLEAARSRHVPTLRAVVEALRKASHDDSVVGMVAHIAGKQPTLAQSHEIRTAISEFSGAGKLTVCWSESYGEMGPGNIAYHLATGFDEIWLQPSGDVGLIGVVAEAVFVRDALDKLAIMTQIGQRAEYKTAANMFMESSMTAPHREMVERIVESAMTTIVNDVAAARRIDSASVRNAIDHAPLTAEEALSRGLVDRLGYRDEVYADLRRRLGEVQLRYVTRYDKGLKSLAAQTIQTPPRVGRRSKPVVAVVQASGGIHLGHSGRSPVGGPSIGSDSLGSALRSVGEDDAVRAVVLRVDSPGGSYVASDAIRREVLALRRTGRPVVASMGSVAGSGGYYIAMPADVVVANPGTLTGSIGVLAGKQVIRDALSRIGVQREAVSSGAYAEMFSTQRPFDDDEWRRMEGWLDRVYADFTGKAAQDRSMPVAELESVAKGRVWTGSDARDRGLVDELGGLEDAIGLACERARFKRSAVDVKALPKQRLVERVRPADNSESPAAATGVWLSSKLGSVLTSGFEPMLATFGLAPYGVLTMPVLWSLA